MLTRPFHPDDLSAVYDLIHAAASMDQTPRVSHDALRAVNRPHDETVIATLASTASCTVAGFIWWDLSHLPSISFEGWVHPAHRRKGVGTALFVAMEKRAHELGAGQLTGRTYADQQGAMALFRLRGFTESRRFHQMWLDFPPTLQYPVPPAGITLRPFHEGDLAELVDADNDAFSTHWGSQSATLAQFRKGMMPANYDPSIWALACQDERIVALCLCRPCDFGGPHDGWISHLGVRTTYRGRGLGRLVLHSGLWRLQQAGYNGAGLHVDSQNIAAIGLYESIGLRIKRERVHFAKQRL